MDQVERVFKSKTLVEGWEAINQFRTWWFDTSQYYGNEYSLDGKGIPICWDDDEFETEETRNCTGDDTCTIILVNKRKKALVIINKNIDDVLINGSVTERISWDEYTREGLWAVKKHCPSYVLEAVIINPKIKTLEKFKVIKPVIKKIVELRDFIEGGDNGPAEQKNPKNKADAATG